jgi:hypothetical protein
MRLLAFFVGILFLTSAKGAVANSKPVDYDSFTTVVHMAKDGSLCIALVDPPVVPGARVVLVNAFPPFSVAYGAIQGPRLPACGDYGNMSYRIAVTEGEIPANVPIIAIIDSKMVITVTKDSIYGKRLAGPRIYFHACTGDTATILSISSRNLSGKKYLWFAEIDVPNGASLPRCAEKENPHYGD